jgi:hypothetical protein
VIIGNGAANKSLQTFFDHENDRWVVVVPAGTPAFSKATMKGVTDYIYKINLDRWHSAAPGDRKERIGTALKALQEGRVVQHLTGKGDQVMFQSTEKMNPDRTIFT